MEIATKEFLASIEKLAQEKKESIRNSNSVYDRNGNIYYVSENGDDCKDGLSPKNALKTLEKAGLIDKIILADNIDDALEKAEKC